MVVFVLVGRANEPKARSRVRLHPRSSKGIFMSLNCTERPHGPRLPGFTCALVVGLALGAESIAGVQTELKRLDLGARAMTPRPVHSSTRLPKHINR